MSNVTQTQVSSANVTISGSTNARITNLNVTSTGVQFSHSLISNLKQLMVKSRVGAKIQYAWNTGETNTNFVTLNPGTVLSLINLSFSGKVLYLEADKTGIVEIQELY